MMNKIILKGYYGFGNLGDDILMITSFKILTQAFPKHHIIISTAAKDPGYIPLVLGDSSIEITNSSNEPDADLIFHGGGGIYYDFNVGSIFHKALNCVIRYIGLSTWSKIYRIYQAARFRPSAKFGQRVGMGIGVGTFTPSSTKYYYKMAELESYNAIYVRDPDSFNYLSQYHLEKQKYLGSDLAFLKEYWQPPAADLVKNKVHGKFKVGFVLRDWNAPNSDYFEPIKKTMAGLIANNIEVKLFSFDPTTDIEFAEYFKDYDIIGWDPYNITLTDYLRLISDQHLLVTSRAHGTIVGASLGVPAISLGIEHKLRAITKLFQNSGICVDLPLDSRQLCQIISQTLHSWPQRCSLLSKDFEGNRSLMVQLVDHFKRCSSQVKWSPF